ncbi:MAG: D-alanyl-D-alanine carboxypeptidase/D-alanyl-D-alanine-endopeptidase [Planctomycetota bacterium]|nr:D-alanyl-D-alanine carboxypeptidase/D-alanyl-D-alanine-endopeptidase [Planctomycetota bacterium]
MFRLVLPIAALLLPYAPAGYALEAAVAAQQVDVGLRSIVSPIDAENHIRIGVRIEDLEGDTIFDFHGDRELVLASNNKLFTTAAALLVLPSDYRWHTRSYLTDQTLRVVGGGDPSLRKIGERDVPEQYLASLAKVLKKQGVTRLERVELDATAFDDQYRHPLWPVDQSQKTYCAPMSALSLHGGCTQVNFRNGGFSTALPLGGSVEWRKSDKAFDSLSAWLGKDDFQIHVRRPRSGRSSSVQFAMKNPLEVFRVWIREGLKRHGVAVDDVVILDQESVAANSLAGQQALHDWPSVWNILDVVTACNKVSDNYLAENLMKTIAMEVHGSGSYPRGLQAIQEIFPRHEIEGLEFAQADGSGMARQAGDPVNTSTPADLCQLLREMALREQGAAFFDSLPIAGVEGRLGTRFRNAAFKPQRVHAKTGFIAGASSLSGYLLMPNEEILVFSIVVNFNNKNPNTNNARFKKMQEQLLERLIRNAM